MQSFQVAYKQVLEVLQAFNISNLVASNVQDLQTGAGRETRHRDDAVVLELELGQLGAC